MTHQDEECAMEILKNMSPVPSLLEMAEELGKKDYIIAKDCEALEKESSKTYESLQEADIESLVPSPEKGSSNESTEEHGTHNAASSEINVEPLQSGNNLCSTCINSSRVENDLLLLLLLLLLLFLGFFRAFFILPLII
jgi:hypothetical protein